MDVVYNKHVPETGIEALELNLQLVQRGSLSDMKQEKKKQKETDEKQEAEKQGTVKQKQ